MTPTEEGAYIHLLAIAWDNGDCSLPNNDKDLAMLSRLNEGWFNGSGEKIRKNFYERDGKLYNKRLEEELKKQQEWRNKSSKGGKKSAKSKARQQKQKGKGGSRVVQPKGNTSSSSSSSSSSSETITKDNINISSLSLKKATSTEDILKEDKKKSDVIILRDCFCEKFKEKTGEDYVCNFGKEGKILKELLKVKNFDRIKQLMDLFFLSEDKFIRDAGYTIGVFKSQINKLSQPSIKKRTRKEMREPSTYFQRGEREL